MKSLLTRKQTLILLSILSAIFIGLYVIAAYFSTNDIYLQNTGEFELTIWQFYVLAAKPVAVVAAFVLTPLGATLLAMSASKRRLLSFGVLSVIVGLVCAILAWPLL